MDFFQSTGISCRPNIPGTQLTTFAIGGPISYLVEPENLLELQTTLKYFSDSAINYRILGAGSNLLIPDSGVADYVLRLGRGFRYINPIGSNKFEVGGATSLMTLCRDLSNDGFSGLEFAGGIPASMGGALRMNAGAHKGDLSSIVERVVVLDKKGSEIIFSKNELKFSYRYSDLPKDSVVTSVVISLKEGNASDVLKLRAEYLAERKRRQPLTSPSAGSVFKNPTSEITAGMLIERAGLKGGDEGGAKISELHANWIVNESRRATADNVEMLIKRIRETVRKKEGFDLVPEVVTW